MGYLSKKNILLAYENLSHLSKDPSLQGATQKVSAIRYFMALDSFYKKYNRECNTRDKDDKKEFCDHVGFVCDVCSNLYTPNFYYPLKEHSKDYGVGSNFYSAGQVNSSIVNPKETFIYPKRGGTPLFKIKNGVLLREKELYTNLNSYIENTSCKVAFVLWLLRKIKIDDSIDIYDSIHKSLNGIYSDELLNILMDSKEEFKKELYKYNITLNENVSSIKEEDINSLFMSNNIEGRTFPSYKMNYDLYINRPFITALHTKPFLLLAGISGTGKSQKVQELAYMTCPEELQEDTAPGNYCLVEVKPNWHDSTELLGYYSALTSKYELTDFIRFIYKAIKNDNVPFFLCLDEMNLAPVEQYFAEYLSVLETRKKVNGKILTQPLLKKDVFANCMLNEQMEESSTGKKSVGMQYVNKRLYSKDDEEIINYLKDNGLSLPENLFIIGTVNMDDTTHQFSRKVIDRAFTIEMNGGSMAAMFSEESKGLLEYRSAPWNLDIFKPQFVRAYEVLDDKCFAKYAEKIKSEIPTLLGDSDGKADSDSINGVLNNTPFRVSYRVQNELVLYLSTLIEQNDFPEEIDGLISEAVLAILLEKVLPRVQGEKKQLETKDGKSNVLKDLKVFVSQHFAPKEDEKNELYDKVIEKLDEMDGKLDNYYTNFF